MSDLGGSSPAFHGRELARAVEHLHTLEEKLKKTKAKKEKEAVKNEITFIKQHIEFLKERAQAEQGDTEEEGPYY
ncbi:hypothetical protein HY992_03155 [Candidatus Micrarchaeota archaeon]|nr:hypothetical protein [Candidatus Micrarchaeota archaeon]